MNKSVQAHQAEKTAAAVVARGREQQHNAAQFARQTPPSVLAQRAALNPQSLTPRNVLQLQRSFGDRAVNSLLKRRSVAKPDAAPVAAQAKESPAAQPSLDSAAQVAQLTQGEAGGSATASTVGGKSMPEAVRVKMEDAFNADFSSVRIHEGIEAASVGALAYTRGDDIHFAQGKFQPDSLAGQQLIGHELAHVVQQRQGRVQPTTQAKGLPVNDDEKFEAEADELGWKAARGEKAFDGGTVGAGSAAGGGAIQRRMGLELEVAVPVDQLGNISQRDKKVLAGTVVDAPRYAELRSRADIPYAREILKTDTFKVLVDHSSRVLPNKLKFPPTALSKSILEFVFEPPVETEEELTETIKACRDLIEVIDAGTNGLKDRAKMVGEYYVGPHNNTGKAKPPEVSYEAAIQVNIGIDTRQFSEFISWYRQSAHKPTNLVHNAAMLKANAVAEKLTNNVKGAIPVEDVTAAQGLNGLKGLLSICALYLVSGADDKQHSSTIKNFTPLLSKTNFYSAAHASLTPKEIEILGNHKKSFMTTLLLETRPGEDIDSRLIKRKNKKGEFQSNYLIKHLFANLLTAGNPPLTLPVEKEIKPDPVGPERTDKDKSLIGAETRRRAMVVEVRTLPGRHTPDKWLAIGKAFLNKAAELNAKKDYAE